MQLRVTCEAERNQILVGITATLAPELYVVNLEVGSGPATLASPAVPPQDLLPEPFVRFRVEPQAGTFRDNAIHAAFPVISCRKACLVLPAETGRTATWTAGVKMDLRCPGWLPPGSRHRS